MFYLSGTVAVTNLHLAVMSHEHRARFEAMLDEYRAAGEAGLYTGFYESAWDGYDAYRSTLERLSRGAWPIPEIVPGETLFVMHGDRIVGEVYLRFRLTPALEENGGNVGYQIRPSDRRRGYGTEALRLALRRLREVGLSEALITCDDGNAASIRVIEKCGGRRIEDSRLRGKRRYIVALGEPGET